MNRGICCAWLLSGVLICCGCNSKQVAEPAESPSADQELIAVIDLNLVAEEIGARTKIDMALDKREKELLAQFNGLKSELTRRETDLQDSFNDDLNDDQQNELDHLRAENQSKLNLQAQTASTRLAEFHAQLKQKLLNDIRPVAYQVAQDQGMKIVLTVGQVYAAGPNVDITQAVIKHIQSVNAANPETTNISPRGPVARVGDMPGGGEFVPNAIR
ncbi:MAG: OmpH family outer membrane protein [Pirellulaceae bacterium]